MNDITVIFKVIDDVWNRHRNNLNKEYMQLRWHKKCVLGVHDMVVQILKSQKFLTICRLFSASEFTKYGKIIHSLYMALTGNWKKYALCMGFH